MAESEGSSEGPATDAANTPVVDPTQNVFRLVDAAIQRQDDLREQQKEHVKETVTAQKEHFQEMIGIRERYEEKLRDAEKSRLDSIRLVDVQNVQRGAEVAEKAVQALAAQVPVIAEAARAAQAQALAPITTAIAELQRAQYELQGLRAGVGEGKDTAAEFRDALAPMVSAITDLQSAREQGVGGKAATAEQVAVTTRAQTFRFALIGAGIAAVGLFLGIAGVVITLVLASRGK